MSRALIVAKIRPGAERDVARVFADSDAGPLPRDAGVLERSLYVLNDLYVHVVDFEGEIDESMESLRGRPEFQDIGRRLEPYIAAYDPAAWRSPKDAMARRFYHWRA
ncbi:TcmI family type II polyketide cyclase [Actinomadura sp. NTSP31]|uniref:TcmI family type II polyketide cyclase n=1 Tax=Actinomadura sp. NTSP31 TaxID=1735447 RepID=UPI0035BF43E4